MVSKSSVPKKPSLAVANQRDVGLARAIGPWALAASIVNVVVGAGIFAVPAALAANIGPYAPLAFLVCAIAVASVAICFAEGGSRIPTSGGAYGYVNAAFGPFTGYVAGTTLWFSSALACGGIAAALADLAGTLLPVPLRSTAHAVVVFAVVGGIALVNLGGVARGARLITAATVLKLIPLAIFVIAGVGAIQRTNFVPIARPGTEDLGRALILALFTFTGMETPLSASGEVAQPARTIPRALAISMLFVTALYVAIQVVAQGILGPALAQSEAPLADAMARISPALRLMMLAGAAVSMFGWIGSDMLGTPRVLFAFARDGLLPRGLGRIHANSSAPHVAILCYAALVIGLALTGTFAELAVLSTLCIAVLYTAGCAAAWWLARGGVAFAGAPLNFRWLGAAAAMAIASMLVLVALASRAEIIGLLAVLGISAGAYVLQTRLGRARV
jgi:basic amino acid/polyamine antiporter, APA family